MRRNGGGAATGNKEEELCIEEVKKARPFYPSTTN